MTEEFFDMRKLYSLNVPFERASLVMRGATSSEDLQLC